MGFLDWILRLLGHLCFVHPIFSSFGFWYFGHFSCVIFFPLFFRLAHLALQNVNKDGMAAIKGSSEKLCFVK